ncbi:MAG: hypothetical protein AUF63_00035 [Candidatus Rokubacteria bacterium 13_1_20CM_70_15]|nr:MAG: hypothetical protein AUF63_00035 [Candidatus Rokubacteria bacterium 13_1_20CM_70_15]
MTASRGVSPARARPPHDLLDQILALDPGRRGIATFFRPGAALAAGRALIRARRVLIVTGFAVNRDTPETDGPPGAAVLGRALRSLGARVRYVTDRVSAPIVGAALAALGEPPEILVGPDEEDAARALLAKERPTHLVAIERPGRNRAGDYLSMRGESVAAWNAPLDGMFLCSGGRGAGAHRRWPEKGARWLRPCTIGIGDGGNEIGMGVARAGLRRLGPLLATRIASVVSVDHLVVAGVSNWGGYGVVAALSRLAERDLLHTPKLERHLVEACVAAGASDGVTRRREPTVDGLPIEAHAAVVELLRWAARSGIIPA